MTALNAVAIARSVIEEPRRAYTVSVLGFEAVCRALVEADEMAQSVISTELAQAARALIKAEAEATMAKGPEGYAPLPVGLAREMALHTFKTLFELEFPNE